MPKLDSAHEPSSFRDPSGFIFYEGKTVLRQVNKSYQHAYDQLMQSGLYAELVKKELLIPHKELPASRNKSEVAYKLLKPLAIPFISYPYEWSFSQLKDAALLTIEIQKTALKYDMILKDASAYNVQFMGAKPVFIDTLSFDAYKEGSPWIAYQQFCQQFLAPLALSTYTDIRFGTLSAQYIGGVPLDLAKKLLPRKTWLNLGLMTHIHLHASSQSRLAESKRAASSYRLSKQALLGTLDNLHRTIGKLQLPKISTEWGAYYEHTNYSAGARKAKESIITEWILELHPKTVCDLGANTGEFSRIASARGSYTVSCDIDPLAVEHNFRKAKDESTNNLLPLIIDLTNPSPSLGFANTERQSFLARASADVVMSLALLHHLAISHNLPLEKIAAMLSPLAPHLIMEWIPKEDSNAKRLLASREDIFDHYNEAGFESAFKTYFTIEKKEPIKQSNRVMYLMKRKRV